MQTYTGLKCRNLYAFWLFYLSPPQVIVRLVKRLFSLLRLVVLWKCDDVSEEPTAFIVTAHLLWWWEVSTLLPDYEVTRHRKIHIPCRDKLKTNWNNFGTDIYIINIRHTWIILAQKCQTWPSRVGRCRHAPCYQFHFTWTHARECNSNI